MSRNDLPSEKASNFSARLRETIQTMLGTRGDKLDRVLTLRDLTENDLFKLRPGATVGTGTLPLIPGDGLPTGGTGDTGGTGGEPVYVPDLTPPPTPDGFAVDAAISHFFVTHAAPLYPQGHGHLRTRVYGVTVEAGDPLPTFTDAVEIDQFTGVFRAIPSNPATTWHLWIKWETVDRVLSPSPAGGTNGLSVTTAQDVAPLLEALTGQITASQLYTDLATPIASIPGLATATADNAAAIAQESLDRVAAISAEALARGNALAQEAADRAAAVTAASLAESDARAAAIGAVDNAIRADLATADAAVTSSLTSAYQAADAATLASAQSYAYSKSETDGAISAQGTLLTADFTAADAATLASANSFTYARSTIDAAITATLATLRAEYAAADTTTLASAQSYTFSQADINSAISTSASTLRAQLTGGNTGTDLNALTSGLLYQERIARVSATDSLTQQLTLLSAGAGEQFDYKNIWYFDSGVEGWTANVTTDTAVTAVDGWLRMAATTGTQTGRMFQSPAALGIEGAKYPQVRLRVRRVGSPTWVGRLYFITTADATWNTTKSLVADEPTYDTNNIGLLTFNMPAGWTGATIAQVRFEASTNVTTANYFELDWAAIGRPSPGASSAQLAEIELAMATADAAEAAARLTLAAEVAGKASATAVDSLTTRVTAAEGVNTSQGTALTSLTNDLTSLTGTVGTKADAAALTALTTRVTAAEGVNTSQGTSITSLNSSITTLTNTVNTKASATALTDLTTRVTAAEGVNTSQSTSLTTLSNSLTTLTGTVGTKADTTALNALTTTVTGQGTELTAQGTRVGVLESTVNNGTTGVLATATALDTVKTTVNNGTTGVVASANRLTALETTVNTGPNSNTALRGSVTNEATVRAEQDTILANSISTVSSTLTTTTGIANSALSNAAAAQNTANTANTAAGTANNLLADIANDARLTPNEKSQVRAEWNVIAAEKAVNNTQATTFAITTQNTAYNTAFQALANYLNNGVTWSSGIPSWISDAALSTTTTIVGATFRNNWKAYYDARTALLNAIALRAKTLADAAQATANLKADATVVSGINTRVGIVEGQIVSQAGQITTISSAVGANTSAISTESTTRATQTGELYAQYTIKADVGNLISGYGLASTANNAAPTSAFGVQAGQFFVAPPTVNQATAPTANLFKGFVWRNSTTGLVQYWTGSAWSTTPQTLPFVIQTTPQVINGFTVEPGIYGEAAFFARLVATRGQIGLLSVDDARIASVSVGKLVAGSISVGEHIQSTGYVTGSDGWRINGDGTAEFSGVVVRGTVYANAGLIGGITIASNAVRAGQTAYNTGSGFHLGSDGRFSLGNSAGNRLTWDGTNLNVVGGGTFSGALSAATGTFAGRVSGGEFTTGAYTGYAWPPAGAGNIGTYLGPSGLLIGNENNGKYLQVTSDGNIYTPGFDVVDGTMTVTQANIINTLNLAGNAVTVPAGSASNTNYAWASTTEQTLLSVTIDPEGGGVFIVADFSVTPGSSDAAGSSPSITVSIKRGGTTLRTMTSVSGRYALCWFDGGGVSGATTYSVTAKGNTSASSIGNSAGPRSLVVIGTKR